MNEAPAKDRGLLSVSIAAGPSVTSFLDTSASARTGLLTSTRTDASKELTVFHLPRESNPEQIVNEVRAIAGKRSIDHLIIECEPDRPPMAYASLFATAGHLPQNLIATVFVIQPANFLDAILGRGKNSLPACFVAEQMEFVSHILLDAASGDPDFDLARSIALALNPRAEVLPLSSACVILRDLSAASFDFEAALAGAGWRQLLDGAIPTHLTDERITALAYRAPRPFHPSRLWDLLQKNLGGMFRAKGFFWLATRMDEVGGLNLAGSDLRCASAGTWWAAREQSGRGVKMPERTRNEWKEPFGDRRQTFAVMALEVDRPTLQAHLDACLLTDQEMADGPEGWKNFDDPFPSWSHAHHHHDHDHQCEHQQDSDEHDCCHH
ncbi:MAG: GTP-binding protein [Verrucomicrobiota bacterium]|nr:GTP-binding protein [Verrucomicrobiota bacterium]